MWHDYDKLWQIPDFADVGWGVGECMGVGHFDRSIVSKFGLLVALLGGIGGRPWYIREWFVARTVVGLDHIWHTTGDEGVVSKIGGGEFVVMEDPVG